MATDLYKTLDEISKEHNERNDCAVKALAVVTGKSYDTCHDALKVYGRRYRCGTQFNNILNALRDLGCKANKVEHDPVTIRNVKRNVKFKGKYLALTRDHICGVLDHEVHDHNPSSLQRVVGLFEVVNHK